MRCWIHAGIVVVLPLVALSAQETRPSPVLKGLDPVDLVQGTEKAGVDAWTIERGRARYVFASAANLEAFQKDPAKYEIQLGGACGRMGPGSGRGNPSRFAVADGKIYVFASDQCRTSFLKAPAKFLDPDDAPPAGDDAARKTGAELVEKAVAALGGSARLDPNGTYESVRNWKTKTRDGESNDRERLRISGNQYRLDQHWGEWSFTTVVTGATGFSIGNSGNVEDLHETAVRDVERRMLRDPLLLFRARGRPGFSAAAINVESGGELSWVAVGVSGATTVLGIDPKSGRVLETRYRGRGPELWYGEVVERYGDFKDAGGVAIPHRIDLVFEGKPRPELARVFETITMGGKIDASVYGRPAKDE